MSAASYAANHRYITCHFLLCFLPQLPFHVFCVSIWGFCYKAQYISSKCHVLTVVFLVHAAGSKVKDLENEADRLMEKIKPIQELQDNLKKNISQIKELINQARKQANSVSPTHVKHKHASLLLGFLFKSLSFLQS